MLYNATNFNFLDVKNLDRIAERHIFTFNNQEIQIHMDGTTREQFSDVSSESNLFAEGAKPADMSSETNLFGVASTTNVDEVELILGGNPSQKEEPAIIKPEPAKPAPVKVQPSAVVEETPLDPLADNTPEGEEVEETEKKPTTTLEGEDENPVTAWANDFYEAGILNKWTEDEEDPITDIEQLQSRLTQEVQNRVQHGLFQEITAKHGQEGWEVYDAIFNKGVDPQEFFASYNQIGNYEQMDVETNETNQELVVRNYYLSQGFSNEVVAQKIQRLKDMDYLADEAKQTKLLLVKNEEASLNKKIADKELQNRQLEQARAEYNQNVNSILSAKLKEKDFDGIPLTDKVALEVRDYLTKPAFRIPSTGEEITAFDNDIISLRRPENHALKVKLALLVRNKLDLSKVKQKAITEETNKTFGKAIKTVRQSERKTPAVSSNFGTSL